MTPAPAIEARLHRGTAEVDTWTLLTERDQLAFIPALERDLHLWDEGRMVAWLVEMDTKYAHSEAVTAPHAPAGQAIARFWPPTFADADFMEEWASYVPTELIIPLPTDEAWTLRVLGGRYDHYVVLTRS